MKWDIDRELRHLTPRERELVRLGNEVVNIHRLLQLRVKPTAEEETRGYVTLWFVTFGQEGGSVTTFWGRNLRDACLRASKYVRKLSVETLSTLGLQRKQRRQGRYVRGKKKPKQSSGVEG